MKEENIEEYIAQQNKRFYERSREKGVYRINIARWRELKQAHTIAKELFPYAKIHIGENPGDVRSMLLYVDDINICIYEEEEIELFKRLISKAAYVDIYPVSIDKLILELCFHETLVRI